MLSRCAVEIHTLPVNQDYSLNILLLKDYWGLHSYRRDTQKGRHAYGIHMVYRETFLSIWMRHHQDLIHKNCINGIQRWTVSQRFSHLQWRRLFKELWGRPTTTADFGSSFWQVPYASNLCVLEDKIQDRGMYFFTISYGSDAMDQGSGVGWFSGWIEIFVIYSWFFNAGIWSTWRENCFSPEQNHP